MTACQPKGAGPKKRYRVTITVDYIHDDIEADNYDEAKSIATETFEAVGCDKARYEVWCEEMVDG